MDWLLYAVVLPALLFALGLAVCAFHWTFKHGQVRALWLMLRSLVDRSPAGDSDDGLVSPAASSTPTRASTQS